MYTDRHGTTWQHNHDGNKTGRSKCPECNARNRDSKFKRDRELGRVKDSGRTARMAAMSPAERLAHNRQLQREGSARYRATEYGKDQIDRRDHKWYTAILAYWESQGIALECSYCDGPFEHVDHFMPRALGGTDDFENLKPACAPCNWSKNDKHPDIWMAIVQARN